MLSHPAPGVLRQVTDTAAVVLADNPGPMTLEGTNSWVLRAPGSDSVVIVDPGPRSSGHLRTLAAQGHVELILITHRHIDHTASIDQFVELTRAPVRAVGDRYVRAGEPLRDNEVIDAAGLQIAVHMTPGHTADSVSFAPADAVLTGDTILGRGTTVLDSSDGDLGDYLRSLEHLRAIGRGKAMLPGHGPDLADAAQIAEAYLAHREERLQQVRDALDKLGPKTGAWRIVRHVYADVDKRLWPAALSSVKAQLKYLRG